MKRLFLLFGFLGAFAVAASAQGRLEHLTIKSEVLGVEKPYSIYLPEGYDTSDERYPVLYLLHGAYSNHFSWNRDGGGELPRVANEEIAAGRIQKMIVVMPDASGVDGKKGGKNMGYFNVEGWPYETFFFDEFIPYIDKTFKTIATKECRAIAGLSMGGGGSVVYAQRHPDMFNACYSTSGLLDHYHRIKKPTVTLEWLWSVAETSPVAFLQKASAEDLEKLRTVRWMADWGDDDHLIDVNIRFFGEMLRVGVPIEFRVRDGAHNWAFWRVSLPEILSFSFKKQQ